MIQTTPRDYSFIAPVYDRIFNGFLTEGHQKLGTFLRENNLTKDIKVLEVGVGSGLTLDHLPSGVDYTGIDVNEKMLSLAQTKSKRLKRRKIQLEIMDAHHLEYKANSFDLVIAASVVSAVENPDLVIKEMLRVTKKGGHLAIIANFRNNESYKSRIVKSFDPITKKFLGFRTDLDHNIFKNYKGLKMIKNTDINNVLGFPLSSFIVFKKV